MRIVSLVSLLVLAAGLAHAAGIAPAFMVNIDRSRALQLGLNAQTIANAGLRSHGQIVEPVRTQQNAISLGTYIPRISRRISRPSRRIIRRARRPSRLVCRRSRRRMRLPCRRAVRLMRLS
jgi:hypothetical protein